MSETGHNAVREVFGKTEGIKGLIVLETLKAQMEIAKRLASGKNTKFFLPNELAGLYGAIGSIKEILNLTPESGQGQTKTNSDTK